MKRKKMLAGFGIAVIAVVCIILMITVHWPKTLPADTEQNTDTPSPSEITVIPSITPLPEVTPSAVTPSAPAAEDDVVDIPLTEITDKPTPPAPPDNTADETGNGDPIPTDPDLTNPDKKPDSTPKPQKTDPPKDDTPEEKDGMIYIPGFGYVVDEGGGGHGEKSELDPEHADFDKIIGH